MKPVLTDELTGLYLAHENESNAQVINAYLKNHFESFGLKHPERRRLDQMALARHSFPSETEYRLLFSLPQREYHHFALETYYRDRKNWDQDAIQLIEWMITHKSWWDSVDHLATGHCLYYFSRYPESEETTIEKWNKSDNLWLNRTSIIYQIKRKKDTNLDRLYRSILSHTQSREFFLQKAIGWALREASKYHPDWVVSFCENTALKPLSRREALRLLAL